MDGTSSGEDGSGTEMDGTSSGEDGSGTEMDGDDISRPSIDVNGSEELSSADTDSEVPDLITENLSKTTTEVRAW